MSELNALPVELTSNQKQVIANAANSLGFYMPVVGHGFKGFDLIAEDIQGIYLYDNTYAVVTIYGTNYYKRESFKSAVTISPKLRIA